jgi:hypothetical protein
MSDYIELPLDKRLEKINAEILKTASTRKPLVIKSLLEFYGCREEDFRQFLPIMRRTVPGKIIEETDELGQQTIKYITAAESNPSKRI